MRNELERFKDTYILWLVTLALVIAVVGQTYNLLPTYLIGVAIHHYLAASGGLASVMLVCLLVLHTCSEEDKPIHYIFVAGILLTLGLAFAFSIDHGIGFGVIAFSHNPLFWRGLERLKQNEDKANKKQHKPSARKKTPPKLTVAFCAQRFKATWPLWIVTAWLGLSAVSFAFLGTYLLLQNATEINFAWFVTLLIALFGCLLTLHLCREENLPFVYIYVAGNVLGLALITMWAFSIFAGMAILSAMGLLYREGQTLCLPPQTELAHQN